MKHKTSELAGVLLDEAVAKSLGLHYERKAPTLWVRLGESPLCRVFSPSTEWVGAGSLIDQFDIQLNSFNTIDGKVFSASIGPHKGQAFTQLEAICRAVVMAEIGEEVEL